MLFIVQGFHQLLEQQRFEQEHFAEETDKMEILEFEKLRRVSLTWNNFFYSEDLSRPIMNYIPEM